MSSTYRRTAIHRLSVEEIHCGGGLRIKP